MYPVMGALFTMTAAPGDQMAVRGTCQQWVRDKRQASSRSAGDSVWDQRA